jgi:hypothetical protein
MKGGIPTLAAGVLGLLCGLSSAVAAPVGGPINPADASMRVTIGNESFDNIVLNWISAQDVRTGGTVYSLAGGPITLTTSDGGGSLTIGGASFDPDPFLLFSASATNNSGGPLAYSFSFNAPLSPALTGDVVSQAELGVTLTDGTGNGATVQPLVGQGTMLKSYDLYASGDSISKNVDIGTAHSVLAGAVPSTAFALYTATSSLNCGQPCVTMSAVLSFTLTGNDSVGFSGKVTQTAVPLPAAAWLLLSSLGGIGLATRRRRSPARGVALAARPCPPDPARLLTLGRQAPIGSVIPSQRPIASAGVSIMPGTNALPSVAPLPSTSPVA